MSNNERDHGPPDPAAESDPRGSRSPRSGRGASSSGVDGPNTPTSQVNAPFGHRSNPRPLRPPEQTGPRLLHDMQNLNMHLNMMNRRMWADVDAQRARPNIAAVNAETCAEIQSVSARCEEFAYLATRLLRLANWTPSERARRFRVSGGRVESA